MAELLSECHLL